MLSFDSLSEKEILALPISQEEEDARIYDDFADALRENYPAQAEQFAQLRRQEDAQTYDDFDYTTTNGTITITGYTGPGGAVVIPGAINGLPVTSIGDKAFYACTSLTGISIPSGVASIGSSAFVESGLTSVTLPDTITNIGEFAFVYCINQFGPTNAWVTLDTVTLTNTTQPYFDLTLWRQPNRLYRLVPVP
jgi:hypothetical protein